MTAQFAIPRQRGTTIVEFMIAVTVGLLLLAALAQAFADSSQAHREMQRNAEQIENGRYAVDVLTHDLHHAGFYGQYYRVPDPGAYPDPCAVTDASREITGGLPYPVQAFDAPSAAARPDLSGTSCATLLPSANLVPGTDIVVVRRAATDVVLPGTATVANAVYLQANPVEAEVQFGDGAPLGASHTAAGAPASIRARDGSSGAEVRRLLVHVYFVAPCSRPAGGGATCTGASDDGGRPIPTLKRLELSASAGVTTLRVVPLAEGIASLQVDYGLDNSPAVVNAFTGLKGDGSPDTYVRAPTAAQMPDIVAARIHVLARAAEPGLAADTAKTYDMGLSGTVGPFNDRIKRHLYVNVVRVVNPGGRREIPQ